MTGDTNVQGVILQSGCNRNGKVYNVTEECLVKCRDDLEGKKLTLDFNPNRVVGEVKSVRLDKGQLVMDTTLNGNFSEALDIKVKI